MECSPAKIRRFDNKDMSNSENRNNTETPSSNNMSNLGLAE